MPYKSILVVSDNEAILTAFAGLLQDRPALRENRSFRFACHPRHETLRGKQLLDYTVEPLDIKKAYVAIAAEHDLVISAHCKQLFPPQLVAAVKCINIHPGYNPYNRGWYPQVFSILNGMPLGATIHEIDEQIDHGKIIDRRQVELKKSDTSLTAYNRVQKAEIELLERNLENILSGSYQAQAPEQDGNLNLKQDFNALCEISLEETATFGQVLDRFRALSHPPFKNAYFIDPATGKKVWIELELAEDGSP